jgi:hypothetical protein
MRVRLTKLVAGVAALAALAVGGSALATAGNQTPKAKPATSVPSQPEPATANDTDTIQEGDQSAPDVAGAADKADTPDVAGAADKADAADSATEKADTESATETPDSAASEVAGN